MTDSVDIRFAKPEDAALIADMSRKAFYDTFAKDNTPTDMELFMEKQFSKEKLMDEVKQDSQFFLLAYKDGEPAGYAFLRKTVPEGIESDGKWMEISRIYVLKQFIGIGAGSALMQSCIDFAKEHDASVVWLGVWENNLPAIAFYHRWGFKKFSTHPFRLGNDVQTDWLMKKELN
jgi:diamine N-acetyltransferase